ncbi:MAG: 30S ribosomal protein S21 [Anaerolineales bacterium]
MRTRVRNDYRQRAVRKEVSSLAKVTIRPNESQQQLFRRFRKAVSSAGVLSDVRRKRWFVSKSEERRIAKKKAIRRARRRQYTTRGKK